MKSRSSDAGKIVPAGCSCRVDHHGPASVSPKVTVSFPEKRPSTSATADLSAGPPLNKDEQGRVNGRGRFSVRQPLSGPLQRHRGVEVPGPTGKSTPELHHRRSCAAFLRLCEEACPVDAIELTSLFDLTGPQAAKSNDLDKKTC